MFWRLLLGIYTMLTFDYAGEIGEHAGPHVMEVAAQNCAKLTFSDEVDIDASRG